MKEIQVLSEFTSLDKDLRKLAAWNLNRLGKLGLPLHFEACALGISSKHAMALSGGFHAVKGILAAESYANALPGSVCGYSDFSSVLLWLAERNIPAIHGPMLLPDFTESAGVHPLSLESYMAALRAIDESKNFERTWHPLPILEFIDWFDEKRWLLPRTELSQLPMQVYGDRDHGNFRGISLGGNLTIFGRQIGTRFFPKQWLEQDNILFFEDTNVDPDDILNNLYYLQAKGAFHHTQLLLFGSLDFKRRLSPQQMTIFFQEIEAICGRTLVSACPFGHRQPQESFFLGWETEIILGANDLHLRQRRYEK